MMRSSIASVSVRAGIGGAQRRSDYAFVIPSSDGQVLVEAEIAPADVADARARWRSQTVGWVLAVLALTMLVCTGPLLDARRRARAPAPLLAATAGLVGVLLTARYLLRAGDGPARRDRYPGTDRPAALGAVAGRAGVARARPDRAPPRRVAAAAPAARHGRPAGAGLCGGRGVCRVARLGVRPLPPEHRVADDPRPAPLLDAPAERVAHRDRLRPDPASRRGVLERCARAADYRGGVAAAPQCDTARRPRRRMDRGRAGRCRSRDTDRRSGADDPSVPRARGDRRVRAGARLASGTDASCLADGDDRRDLHRARRAVAGHVSLAARVHDRGEGSADRRTVWPGRAAAPRRPSNEPESRRRGNRRAALA